MLQLGQTSLKSSWRSTLQTFSMAALRPTGRMAERWIKCKELSEYHRTLLLSPDSEPCFSPLIDVARSCPCHCLRLPLPLGHDPSIRWSDPQNQHGQLRPDLPPCRSTGPCKVIRRVDRGLRVVMDQSSIRFAWHVTSHRSTSHSLASYHPPRNRAAAVDPRLYRLRWHSMVVGVLPSR